MKKLENNESNVFNQSKTVSIETLTHSFNIIRIYLTDNGVNGTSEHLEQLEAILSASENDVIEVYCLGCGGGSADSIIMLLNALASAPAHTVTILEGHNASAASMPMMVTDEVRVGMYASVMFHNVAGGVMGNMTNTAEAAKFYEQNYNKFFADLYNKFFDESDLLLIQNGREIYLDAEAIQERLQRRAELLAAEAEEGECSGSSGSRGCEGGCHEGGTVCVDWEEEEAPIPPTKKPSKKKATKA